MLKENVSYKVEGYTNKWSIIDTFRGFVLLENETWGDETCYLVCRKSSAAHMVEYTKKNGEKVILPTIKAMCYETYDGIEQCLIDEGFYKVV